MLEIANLKAVESSIKAFTPGGHVPGQTGHKFESRDVVSIVHQRPHLDMLILYCYCKAMSSTSIENARGSAVLPHSRVRLKKPTSSGVDCSYT